MENKRTGYYVNIKKKHLNFVFKESIITFKYKCWLKCRVKIDLLTFFKRNTALKGKYIFNVT